MASLNTDARTGARAAWRDAAHKHPDEIEHDIDDTRADVQATLEALERKLSPDHLIDLTLGRVRSHGSEFAGNLGHAVKDNPVPLLLTSIGIAWMMMSGRNGTGLHRHDGGSRMRERMHGARDRWTSAKDGARERMSGVKETLHDAREGARERMQHSRESMAHAADSVRETGRRAADSARAQLERARSGADYLIHEQPLVLGAIGIAAGALIGATLPATAEEDRMLGSARDRAIDRAKRAGAEGYRKARDRAEHLAEDAKSRLQGNGRSEGSTSKSGTEASEWPADPADRQPGMSESARMSAGSASTMAGGTGDRSSDEIPSGAWVSGTDNERNERDRSDDKLRNVGENPSEPRRTKRRPSERGVGREHSSDSFSTPDQSPTSKTPPV